MSKKSNDGDVVELLDKRTFIAKAELLGSKDIHAVFDLILGLRATCYEVAEKHDVSGNFIYKWLLEQMPLSEPDVDSDESDIDE